MIADSCRCSRVQLFALGTSECLHMHMALLQRSSAPTSTVMSGGGNTTSPMGTYIDGIAGGGRFATANGEHGGKCIAGVTGLSWRPCLNTSMEKGVAEGLIDGAGGRMAGSGPLELEFHRAYIDFDKPWVSYAHAIVAGTKGDVARVH